MRIYNYLLMYVRYAANIWSTFWQATKTHDRPNNLCYNVFLWRTAPLLQIAPLHKPYWDEWSLRVHPTDPRCLLLSLRLIGSSQKTDGGEAVLPAERETSALKWIAIITFLHVPGTLGTAKLCWQPRPQRLLLVLLSFWFQFSLVSMRIIT